MNRFAFGATFGAGLLTLGWIGLGFVGHSPLALSITLLIAAAYLLGAHELRGYRSATTSLSGALGQLGTTPADIAPWLGQIHPSLRPAVRSRVEGDRVALPGPALTPYLVGLLVMLGMLGTFVGMVLTFQGAVFALEGSADLQAIRSALAAPIKGLGLSFGTSVAGVAASAALGLMSTLARRERAEAARQLDAHVGTELRPFSLAHQRQETFKALQQQSQVLPEVAAQLRATMEALEQRNQQLNEQLLEQQAQFHREVSVAYTELARTVGSTLQDALTAGARAAGDSIRPVVEATMAEIARESQATHQRQLEATQAQVQGLVSGFGATAHTVTEGWRNALDEHTRRSEDLSQTLAQTLGGITQSLDTRSNALMAHLETTATQTQAAQAEAEQARLLQWTEHLHGVTGTLQTAWHNASADTLAQQQAVCDVLARTATDIGDQGREQARQTADAMARLLERSDALVQARIEAEAAWTQQHAERTEQLATLWRQELASLRQDEALRGDAAVARLGELQEALGRQLATLGAALETPMTRLMQTAAEVPQAAAEVIAHMRGEMTRLSERDNAALEERNALVQQLGTLLLAVQQTTTEQRAAIESLVGRAAHTLAEAGQQVGETLATQAAQAADVAARVNGSAVELASLGEAFGHGVQLFSTSADKLMDTLQRIEGTLQQSMARSDEQLAYYVAQAREVIDLSITSQQGLVEDMRRLRSQTATVPEGSAA
ncbi:MAG TPA: DUF802 domain-containing protein [Burkholderiaceae bacterium]|nr:DUF802 domain-containing protein [Burkholderiaceae bacterium]